MNKRCQTVALVGLLAVLFMPCTSHAQIVKAAAPRGWQSFRQIFNGGKKAAAQRSMIEVNLTKAMNEAGLVNSAELKYKPREGVKYPDLNSRHDFQELKWLLGGDNVDLSEVTPLQIAERAQQTTIGDYNTDPHKNYNIRERWTLFALNHGADEREVLLSSLLSDDAQWTYTDWRGDFSKLLVETYGLNINAVMPDNSPLLLHFLKKSASSPWVQKIPGIDWNAAVNLNGDPMIFRSDSPGTFAVIARHINLTETLDGAGADPIHMAAAHFRLDRVLPGGFYKITDINKPDNFGNTYAHYAAEGKYAAENIEYLRKQGADLTRVNDRGETPLGILGKRMARLAGLENPAALGHTVDQFVAPRRGPAPRWD